MPTQFELNRQAVLGSNASPAFSSSGNLSQSDFFKNRQSVLSQKAPEVVPATPTPVQAQPKVAAPSLFEKAKSFISNIQIPNIPGLGIGVPGLVGINAPKQTENVIDGLFKLPDKGIRSVQDWLADPKHIKTTEALVPIQNTMEKIFESNPLIRGFQKGVSDTYLGMSEEVGKVFTKKVDMPQTTIEKGMYTTGQIAGTVISFLAGGEILKGLNFGKATLPVLFSVLGQTSAKTKTTVTQRLEKLPVDAFAGYLFNFVPLTTKFLSPELLKGTGLAAGVMSGQTFINSLIEGLSPKEAFKAARNMAIVGAMFHVAGTATGLFTNNIFRSRFKEGKVEMTPQELRDTVINSNLEKTSAGQELLKLSFDADQQGMNVELSALAAKQSRAAKLFKLKTPEGIEINAGLVEPGAQISGGQELKGTEITTTKPEVPVKTEPKLPGITQKAITETPTPPLSPTEGVPPLQAQKTTPLPEKMTAEARGVLDTVREAIYTGDTDGALAIYETISDVNKPAFESLTEEIAQAQEQELSQVTDELKGIKKNDDPDDPTNMLIGIADKMASHFTAPRSLFKITGKERVYEIPSGLSMTVGGDAKTAFDRLINSSDIEGFKKNIKILSVKFDKVFTEIDNSISAGDIDGADYESFKSRFSSQIAKRPTYAPGNRPAVQVKPSVGRKETPKGSREITFVPQKSLNKVSLEELKKLPYDPSRLEKTVQPPKSVGNPSDKWEAQIRYKGWAADKKGFNTKEEAQKFLESYKFKGLNISVAEDYFGSKVGGFVKRQRAGIVPQKPRKPSVSESLGFNPKNLEQPESSKATQEVKKIIKRSEIAQRLSEKLGVPIRRGKFRRPGAIGIYKHGPKVVRIKSGGLATVFHEVAHYLDDIYDFSKSISPTERRALLEEYATKYENDPLKQRQEAFAEFTRFKLTGQDEKIAKRGPKLNETFEKQINSLPEIKEVLDTAREDYMRWQAQPASAKILSHLSIGSQNKGKFIDRAIHTAHDLYTSALDDLHPLSEFTSIAERKLGGIPAEENPYILARNLRGWVGKADLFLNKGTFGKDYWGKDEKGRTVMKFKGKSYSEIMKPIEKAGKMDEFRVFIVAQRVVNDLAPRDIKSGISLEDAKTALKEISEKNPEFEKIAEERRAYKNQLLEYARDNGLIGDKGLKKIQKLNNFHVPFYRVMEETQQKFLGKTKIAGNLASPIKKIKGSEREIIDPLESDVKDTYAIINAAERNNIGIAMANISGKDYEVGRLFEKVDIKMTPIKVNAVEVMEKAMKEVGAEIPINDDMAELVVTLFRPMQDRGPNMLNVNFGDKQRTFQVDPDLFKSIQGLEIEDIGTLMKVLSFPAKLLRAGATLTPDFSVRNPIRDQFSAFIYSRYGFRPGIDLIRGMFELFKQGDVYNLWKASGGEHSMMVSLDRTALQKNLKEVLRSNKATALDYVKSPLKLLQLISETGEQATRLGEMRQALRKGASPAEAAFSSREVTLDFARIGAKTRAANAIIAFWNANLQGTDKMIRSFKQKPFKTLWRTLLGITLPSILLYFANRKDKRWKEIPMWQKNLFWIILTPKHIIRIPKPFELGIIFGSVPERVLEYIDAKDPEAFNELGKSIVSGFTPGFFPTFAIPVIENITNYSFFMNRPVVSQGQENLPPEAQAGTYTSETAKIIGEVLKYSPSKIDNLVYGYTGGLGKYAVSAMDKILTGTKIANPPVAPAINLEDTPVIKAFMIRNPIGSQSESVNRIYNLYGKTSSEVAYVKKMVEAGHIDDAKKYVSKHPEVANASIYSNVVMIYRDMNKVIDQIRKSRDLTAEQKREKINAIGQLQTDIAQKTLANTKKQ